MPQAFHFDLFLYADNSGLTFQHKDVHKIEHQLKKDFANFYETVVDKKLSNAMYNGTEIKQYSKLTYLGCLLDDTMPVESMAWYPNSTQKLKKKLQIMQNKCICFRLHLDKMSTTSHKEFKHSNWLPVSTRFEQCVISVVFKFFNGNRPYYLNEVPEFAQVGNIILRDNLLKLKGPFRNTNTGQKASSFIGPSFWNQIPDTLKKALNSNTFKHNLKRHSFNQIT